MIFIDENTKQCMKYLKPWLQHENASYIFMEQ